MRAFTLIGLFTLATVVPVHALHAQSAEVVDAAEIEAALETHHDAVAADREALKRVLQMPEARRAAQTLGVETDVLLDAAGVVDGERLATAAEHARAIESQLAGGQTISFNATTLIIILLLIIVVVLIAD